MRPGEAYRSAMLWTDDYGKLQIGEGDKGGETRRISPRQEREIRKQVGRNRRRDSEEKADLKEKQ